MPQELVKAEVDLGITEQDINKICQNYMDIQVQGLEDREGIKAVHDARIVVKKTRIAVEKRRKELKEDALAWGKKVDGEAKRLMGMLEPIEDHLQKTEDWVEEEKRRIREEEEARRRAKANERLAELLKYDVQPDIFTLAEMSDLAYQHELQKARKNWEAKEAVRIEEEVKAKAAEEERLKKEAAEREEAERKRIADAVEKDRLVEWHKKTSERVRAFAELGKVVDPEWVGNLDQANYEGRLRQANKEKEEREAEAARNKEAEELGRKLAEETLAAERKKLSDQAFELKTKEDALNKQKAELEAAKKESIKIDQPKPGIQLYEGGNGISVPDTGAKQQITWDGPDDFQAMVNWIDEMISATPPSVGYVELLEAQQRVLQKLNEEKNYIIALKKV